MWADSRFSRLNRWSLIVFCCEFIFKSSDHGTPSFKLDRARFSHFHTCFLYSFFSGFDYITNFAERPWYHSMYPVYLSNMYILHSPQQSWLYQAPRLAHLPRLFFSLFALLKQNHPASYPFPTLNCRAFLFFRVCCSSIRLKESTVESTQSFYFKNDFIDVMYIFHPPFFSL